MAAPTQNAPASMYRSKEGMGVWEHRGKVAVAGLGLSPADRRWDGRLETSLGAYAKIAVQKALDDVGITVDGIDGVVAVNLGLGDVWAPRPYFEPPYDSEDGLSGVSADWIIKNMGLKNVKTAMHEPGDIFQAMSAGAQMVGDGLANTVLVLRATGNMPGRYLQEPEKYVRGNAQWTGPWGYGGGGVTRAALVFDQYCRKYGSSHDRLAPFVVNERRNGLMMPEGYYAQHRPEVLTTEDYLNGRWICKPASIFDCDLPIQIVGAFILTTAERAKDMKQKPVYVLNHAANRFSNVVRLDQIEVYAEIIARKCYEGAGITAKDVDVFNPYDGFTLFTQDFLEGFGWHGVKKGEAHDFYAGDISVEGPHPLTSGGGNNGNGRTRFWGYVDSIQQLQGRAGKRQVRIKAETAIAGGFLAANSDWMVFGTSPD